MKVILLQNVKDLGRTGEVKDVADGYARNFLFLRKLAVPATAGIVTAMESKKENKIKQEERAKGKAKETAEKLKKTKVEIRAKSDEKGTLFAAEFGVYALEDLNAIKDVGNVFTPLLEKGKTLITEGKLKKEELEGYAVGEYLKVPEEKFKKEGVPTLRETAMEMAHRLSSGIKMSGRLFEGIDVKVNNFTHGPKIECLLKFVLKQENGKTGFDDVKEIGGSVKPSESIDFVVERDERGELKPIKIKFRGEEYDFDMNTFNELVEEYKEKKAKK